MDEYEARMAERAKRLEQLAGSIKRRQETNDRRRTIDRQDYHTRIQSLEREVASLEEELRALATSVKKFIAAFQRVGMKPQLEKLKARAERLRVEEWVTKKELAISSSDASSPDRGRHRP